MFRNNDHCITFKDIILFTAIMIGLFGNETSLNNKIITIITIIYIYINLRRSRDGTVFVCAYVRVFDSIQFALAYFYADCLHKRII